MALSPHTILAERVAQIADIPAQRVRESFDSSGRVLLCELEQLIDNQLRERYQAGTYDCSVFLPAMSLTSKLSAAIEQIYCRKGFWKQVAFHPYGMVHVHILFSC